MSMNQLRKIQENFQSYLRGFDHTIENHIYDQQANSVKRRLYIYKDAYYLRLIEALQKNYPGVFLLLGDDFKKMTTQYIDQKPSQHYSINVFGKGIPRFLKQTAPYSARSELAEMAAFELALNVAIDTLDAPALSPEDMSSIAQEKWPKLKIKPHPSLQILKLKWNVAAIWQAVVEKNPPPPLTKNQTNTWIVWRKDIYTYYVMLSSADAFIIQSMKKNLPVAKICEGLCRWLDDEQVPQYLVNTILRWLHDKLLSEISL
jgi:hypothetical protein